MREFLRKAGRYFGLIGDVAGDDLELYATGRQLRSSAVRGGVLTVICTIALIVLFDRSPGGVVAGTAVGGLLFGAFDYAVAIRRQVPRFGLAALPADAVLVRPQPPGWQRFAELTLLAPAAVGLAWLADSWDVGTVIVPGIWAGSTLACATGSALVSRWEIAHRAEVLARRHGSEVDLYASTRRA